MYIRGDRQVVASLNRLAKGPGARVIDAASNRAMAPMRDDARKRLKAHRNYASKYPSFFPKQKGPFSKHLDRFIVIRKDGKQMPGVRSYKLGGLGRARYLLHILEYGSSPHAQPNLAPGFIHPGATPRPTMVPAFNHMNAKVVDSMQEQLLDWMELQVRKAGFGFARTR